MEVSITGLMGWRRLKAKQEYLSFFEGVLFFNCDGKSLKIKGWLDVDSKLRIGLFKNNFYCESIL